MSREIKRDPHQCIGKVTFETFNQANEVATRRRRSREKFKRQHPYRCEICHRWHIGTQR